MDAYIYSFITPMHHIIPDIIREIEYIFLKSFRHQQLTLTLQRLVQWEWCSLERRPLVLRFIEVETCRYRHRKTYSLAVV